MNDILTARDKSQQIHVSAISGPIQRNEKKINQSHTATTYFPTPGK